MERIGDYLYTFDGEGKEKHVPVIKAPEKVKAGEPFEVTVIVGDEVPHPNTVEHHIKWIALLPNQKRATSYTSQHSTWVQLMLHRELLSR